MPSTARQKLVDFGLNRSNAMRGEWSLSAQSQLPGLDMGSDERKSPDGQNSVSLLRIQVLSGRGVLLQLGGERGSELN